MNSDEIMILYLNNFRFKYVFKLLEFGEIVFSKNFKLVNIYIKTI